MQQGRHWRTTRIEVDAAAITSNVARLRAVAGVEVCAVVKADGYGHGAVTAARAALAGGAAWLAVALVEEGEALRDAGIDAPILLLSEPPVAAAEAAVAARLTPMVYRPEVVDVLDRLGRDRGAPVAVHLKVDTGMRRVGATVAQWPALVARAAAADGVIVEGVATHLARADEPDEAGRAATVDQLDVFDTAVAEARRVGLAPRLLHTANTAGTLLHPRARHTLVRPGIGVYGLSPSWEVPAADHGLRPALRLVTEVAFVKHVPASTPVSYGHRWRAPSDGWLATIPVGYADGLPRAVSSRVEVLHAGRRRPLVGTVTMDQSMVWCAGEAPRVGDEVVLLGDQGGERIRVEEWAAAADTITYEVVTQLTARLPRLGAPGPR